MDERLSEGWVWTTLEAAVEVRDDLRVPINADERVHRSGPYPYYGATGQVGWINDYLMDGEYVLLGEDGAPFLDPVKSKAYIISGKCWVNNHAHVLHFLEGMGNNRYLMYVLNAVDYHSAVNGTTRLKLTQSAMKQMFIPLAPLPEQNRIVAAIEQQFTRLDSAVASLQSAKARVKQYRASLLKAAVEGELTKEWRVAHPAEETGEQPLARILDGRRTRWEEEQLAKMREKPKDDKWKEPYKEPQKPDIRNLPVLLEGWCWATVEQVGEVQLGRQRAPQYHTGMHMRPYLRVANVFEDRIDTSDILSMNFTPEEFKTYSLKYGDILLNEGQSLELLGRPAIYRDEVPGACFQNTLIRFRSHSGILPEYALIVFRAYMHAGKFQKIGKHTTNIAHLGAGRFATLEFPLPPLAEQEQIVAEVEAKLSNIMQMEETIEANLKRAEHERQSILREAFAGRLVPQNPEDEPASVLLERIREERKKREEAEKIARTSRKEIQMEVAKKRRAGKAGLYTTLVEAKRPLPPDDLFKRAGLKTDEQPESVEVFYDELDADVELALIAETRPDDAYVLLEALEPSVEVLARMAEAKAATQAQEAEQGEKTVDAPTLWNI